MTWMHDLQVRDIIENTEVDRLGFTCKKCGEFYSKTSVEIGEMFEYSKYLDEVEGSMKCRKWGCGGDCRMELTMHNKLEGFQGGLA